MIEETRDVRHQISLPLKRAIEISIKSLKIRFGRSVITTGGIVLTIAFLAFILNSSAINRALLEKGSSEVKILLQAQEVESRVRQIWLVTLSLLVCVVGITNAMLMAVTERYKEIGTMKCLGALDRFIVELFLLESGFQGLFGSLVGTILGVLSIILINLLKYGTQVISVFPILEVLKYSMFCISIGIILSVIGAIYPAHRAARMVPADAMRVEM